MEKLEEVAEKGEAREEPIVRPRRKKRTGMQKSEDRQLLLLCLPAIIKVFIFSYLPLIGLIMAFEFFIPRRGLFYSPWVGFENFAYLLRSSIASRLITNAVVINLLCTAFGTVFSILLGLFLFEVANKTFLKIAQTVVIFPYFISWPLAGTLLGAFLGEDTGMLTTMLNSMFGADIDFYSDPSYWWTIITVCSVWKNAGLSAVVYYAILTGTDRSMYEAAAMDGAGRFKQMWYISLANLKLMVVLNIIMSSANILKVDFNMVYFLTNNAAALYSKTDVIETYMYRALRTEGDYSIGTATGLVQGVVGLVLTIITNKICAKISHESLY